MLGQANFTMVLGCMGLALSAVAAESDHFLHNPDYYEKVLAAAFKGFVESGVKSELFEPPTDMCGDYINQLFVSTRETCRLVEGVGVFPFQDKHCLRKNVATGETIGDMCEDGSQTFIAKIGEDAKPLEYGIPPYMTLSPLAERVVDCLGTSLKGLGEDIIRRVRDLSIKLIEEKQFKVEM
eukprot:COSAG01_NODE_2960_length_6792_cov_24.183573_7_plen_181_part_00